LVVFIALLFWAGVFTVYFAAQGTNPLEFFLGGHEPPPADLGKWRGVGELVEGTPRPEGSAGALVREERLLLPGGRAGAAYFLKQVRYRDAGTGEVVRVEPEARVRRRRVSVRG
jgi:hypothetical protein